MNLINLKDIENILCQVFLLKKIPNNIEELKYEDFKEWDSLGNFNLLLAVEEFYGIRFTMDEITKIRSIKELVYVLEKKLK